MLPYLLLVIWITIWGGAYKQVYASNEARILKLQNGQSSWEIGNSSKALNVIYFIIILSLVVFSGFRYDVGADFWSYYYGYRGYLYSSLNILEENEVCILIIARITYVIYDHPQTFIFLCAAFAVVVSAPTIKKYSVNVPLSIFIFLCGGYYISSFNAIRQCLAAAVVFWGVRYIIEDNFTKWALCVLGAFLFHSSAIVFLPAFFVLRLENRRIFYLSLLLSALILFLSYDSIFGAIDSFKGKEVGYIASREYAARSVSFVRVVAMCAPCVLCYYPEKITFESLSESEKIFYNITFFNAVLAIVACKSAYLSRICIYSCLYNVLSVPFLMKIWSKSTALSDFERKTFPILLWLLYVIYYYFLLEGEYTRHYQLCFA